MFNKTDSFHFTFRIIIDLKLDKNKIEKLDCNNYLIMIVYHGAILN